MHDAQRLVRAFHERFGLTVGERPAAGSADLRKMRADLILEEAREVEDALRAGDLIQVARELADLLYVTYGTAVALGIDLGPVFEGVHAANMAKAPDPAGGDRKVRKPPGWQPPDVAAILAAQTGTTGDRP